MSEVSQTSAGTIDRENPWPGLAPFTEDQGAFFHGRDDEIDDLTQLARLRALVVLFGQSGLGKSSLLQAGVFPRLRAIGFCPVYIRLDHAEDAAPLTEQIKTLVLTETARMGAWTKPNIAKPGETLWELFHHRDDRLLNARGDPIIPVLVFDQFEELFTLGAAARSTGSGQAGSRRDRAVAFMAELAELVENRPSEQLVARLDASADELEAFDFGRADYRVVITLREDFLPDLEGMKTIMPALMANRMRLARMTGTQALSAVVKPGAGLVTEEVAAAVVEFVAGARGGSIERLAELNVEPALLSVVCRELNERRRSLGQAQITADLVSGNRREILTDFYDRSVADLPAPMRTFVEDRLLTKSGFRDNLALETALEEPGVTRPLIDTLVARRLLRIEDRAGIQRVELTHDVLAEVIRASRDVRQQQQALAAARAHEQRELALAARRTRRLGWLVGGLAAVVVALGAAGLYGLKQRRLDQERSSRVDVGLAARLLEEGKTTDGLAHLLRAARRDPHNPTIAPRLASLLTSRNFLLPDGAALAHPAPVFWTDFSADGKSIFVLWKDGATARLDLASGGIERSQLPSPPGVGASPIRTPRFYLVDCQDGVIRVLDLAGQLARDIRIEGRSSSRSRGSGTGSGGLRRFVSDIFSVSSFTNGTTVLLDAATGRTVGAPIPTGNSGDVIGTEKWLSWTDNTSLSGSLATSSFSTEVRLRDMETGTADVTLRVPFGAHLWRASPDGRQVAVVQREADDDAVFLKLYALPDGAPLAPAQRIEGATYGTAGGGMHYSPDGRFIVTTHNALALWDARTGVRIARIAAAGPSGRGDSARMNFSPDRQTLATWRNLGSLDLWDLATGAARVPPLRHDGSVSSAEFSADGRVLVTTASDGFVRVWDVATGQLVAEPALQQRTAPTAALSPNRTQVVMGTREGAVYRFRIGQGRAQSLALPRAAPWMPLPFLPGSSGRMLWMLGDRARVMDVASGREVAGGFAFPEPILGAATTTGSGATLGPGVRNDFKVMVVPTVAGAWQAWWLGDGKVEPIVPLVDSPTQLAHVAFSASGDRVVLAWNLGTGQGGNMRTWHLRTGQPVGPVINSRSAGSGLTPGVNLNPDGTRVTVGANVGVGKVWDTATGAEVLVFDEQGGRVPVLLFSPDGRRIATTNNLGEAQFWDSRTGDAAGPVMSHADAVLGARFSPDGNLATYSADGVARVWQRDTGAPIGEPLENRAARYASLRFSADGGWLVTASNDGLARVWDARSGLPAIEPLPHGGAGITVAEFSPDGRFVQTRTANGTTYHLWSVPPPLPAGATTPAWLLDLAAICAGKTVNADGAFESAAHLFGKIADIRRTLAALPDDAPYVEWGRWFLSNRATRSVAPGFTITPAEAEKLAAAKP
ncbi:MAG: hypothetical protein HZA93_06155 [Verrucomicrobia bacterium]|nr:hypothetical protein [Verrucomicrobiota bacterium]